MDLISDITNAMKGSSRFGSIDAGYTYIGQMISHDIVPITNPIHKTRNVTKELNLDSLYGNEEARYFDHIGEFKTNNDKDLARQGGVALIPESRNDENVIIAQLHLLWQRIHNKLLDKNKYAYNWAHARNLTTLLFQLIVVEDFLRQLLNYSVYNEYFRKNKTYLSLDTSAIPSVFSHAAFRFGHSMTRPSYRLHAGHVSGVGLIELIRANQKLPDDFHIDWNMFFGWPGSRHEQNANWIDTKIDESMFEIPGSASGRVFNIPKLNLIAGVKLQLPTGMKLCNKYLKGKRGKKIQRLFSLMPLRSIIDKELASVPNLAIDNMPLWPYLLLEAKSEAKGNGLGVLGSLICAEVLLNSMKDSRYSIYRDGEYHYDEVIQRLGKLGEHISTVVARNADKLEHRRFCMKLLLETLEL